MNSKRRLLCILAHPDDESMGTGGILAKYSAENVETYVITATRGQVGWSGAPEENPGPDALATLREAEERAATQVLGVQEVQFLDYVDGQLDQADPAEIIGTLVQHIRRIRPQVVVTFAPDGAYGHPDHIAISQFTGAALVAAADAGYAPGQFEPHRTAKLYYLVSSQAEAEMFRALLGDFSMPVDDQIRGLVAWEDWAITTKVDTADYWSTVHAAISCHESQIQGDFQRLLALPTETQIEIWGCQFFYRAYSMVNGGRQVEHDLFAGID